MHLGKQTNSHLSAFLGLCLDGEKVRRERWSHLSKIHNSEYSNWAPTNSKTCTLNQYAILKELSLKSFIISKNKVIKSSAAIVDQEIQISLLSLAIDFTSANSIILGWFLHEGNGDHDVCQSGGRISIKNWNKIALVKPFRSPERMNIAWVFQC